MKNAPRTLLKIRKEYSSFHGNYIRIADRILADPALLIRGKVADVARSCGCDSAQIIRFCKKLGFGGFSDMKQAIIRDLIPFQTEATPEELNDKQGFRQLAHDFRAGYRRVVDDTVTMFDEEILLQAVGAIRGAHRIMICGVGASGIVGEDFQMKLVRMGYPAHCHGEPATRRMLCALLGKGDLMIAISFRGKNREVLECAKLAKGNGCRILAITNFRTSPLAEMSDIPLLTAAEEDDFRIGAMTSRLSQLMVVDMLAVLLATRDMENTGLVLAKTNTMLNDDEENAK